MINPERCDNNFVFLKISMILSCSEKVLLSEKRKEKRKEESLKNLHSTVSCGVKQMLC